MVFASEMFLASSLKADEIQPLTFLHLSLPTSFHRFAFRRVLFPLFPYFPGRTPRGVVGVERYQCVSSSRECRLENAHSTFRSSHGISPPPSRMQITHGEKRSFRSFVKVTPILLFFITNFYCINLHLYSKYVEYSVNDSLLPMYT